MSERYSKLFALSENLYSAGAPVVIAAGALQKDNQTGKVFAQLKIRNIQDKAIKAVTVKITPFDTVGKPLGGVVDYQYLDLAAARDIDFGQKTPVMLKEAATRSFAVSVSEVIFSDNSIWTASDEAWEPLSAPVTPEKEFTDVELAKQYRVKYGADCKCVFKKEKDLWRCACGAVNHDSEKNCHSCQREAAALAALNVEELKADRDRRLAAEQKKAAEEKAAAAEQAKKTKKIAMIAAPFVVIALIAVIILGISNAKKQEMRATYESAVEMMDQSIAGAYELLSGLPDDYEQVSKLKETCAPYIPYCGNYPVGSNGKYFVSDFWLSAKDIIIWHPNFNDLDGTMSVFYMDGRWQPGCWGDLRDTHQFFRGGIGEPVSISDGVMTCVSTAKDDGVSFTATVTFENGDLYYVIL